MCSEIVSVQEYTTNTKEFDPAGVISNKMKEIILCPLYFINMILKFVDKQTGNRGVKL